MSPTLLPAWLADSRRHMLIMGVLNVTPDSFSDGGRFSTPDAALAHARAMADDGADWIDIGAESTRPGSSRVNAADQISRLRPLLAELRRAVDLVLSIDTTLTQVASMALDAGVDVINDISAGRDDPDILALAAAGKVPIILAHMQGTPATMQQNPQYANVTSEVCRFLAERRSEAARAGVRPENVLLDPGIGFGKTSGHNLELLRDIEIFAALCSPVVIGTSRKKFIEKITGESAESGRPFGTAASVAWAAMKGASIVRVHDVKGMGGVARMIRAIQSGA